MLTTKERGVLMADKKESRKDHFAWKEGDLVVAKRVYKGKEISEAEWEKIQKAKQEKSKK